MFGGTAEKKKIPPNSCQRFASGSQGFSFQPHYHVLEVICLETRRCCALTRRPIVLSGAWTLPLDLSASVGYEEAATLLLCLSFLPTSNSSGRRKKMRSRGVKDFTRGAAERGCEKQMAS